MDIVQIMCSIEYISGYLQHFWQNIDVSLNVWTTDLKKRYEKND